MEVSNSRGASQPDVASGGAGQPALQKLVDEIIQLGHMPRQSKNASVEEKRLARRLIRARKAGSLTREHEAALGNIVQASIVETPTVMEQLMDEISQLGHVPTRANTASIK